MTDIQQWRRMIQPTRARTPAVEHEDSDAVASPTTPKRGLKPKFSSYFSHHGATAHAVKTEPSYTSLNEEFFPSRLPSWPDDQPYPNPNADELMNSVMCRLMSEPYASLEPRFNGMLLQIFECYRDICDEKLQLQARLEDEVNGRKIVVQRLKSTQNQWSEEMQDYKAEVKRLELLLAKGKRGVAEVTLARQDSLLRQKDADRRSRAENDGLETIFEFLEKTKRYEDKAWSSQRAAFGARQPSPSAQMRRLSKQLISKKSMTNIHADLPFGTPPDTMRSTLAEASMLECHGIDHDNKRTETGLRSMSEPNTSFSDDTFSTFSCVSDLLPDETADVNLIQAAGTDNDFVAIKRIAHVLARRRNIDPSDVMPKLTDLFCAQALASLDPAKSASVPTALGVQPPTPRSAGADKVFCVATMQKHPSLMAKASGFFQKLRPQLNLDTSSSASRRFSFEAGDDAVVISPPLIALRTFIDRDRTLRKSVSLSSLPEWTQKITVVERALSPVAHSPTATAPPSESRRPSRIPTPVHRTGSVARPRQEREDSASSLLTAFKHSASTRRSDSMSSSVYSSPSASRIDLSQRPQSSELTSNGNLKAGSSNRLLDHTIALRGSALANAQKAATNTSWTASISNCDLQHAVHRARSRASECNSGPSTLCLHSDMSEGEKENIHPMTSPSNLEDEVSSP